MEIEAVLKRLCGLGAPSGFERPAVEAARELLEPLVDEVWTDRLGNLIGVRRCGRPGAKRLLLDAHLDEIGMVVTGRKDGFLRFRPIGGVDPRMLPDRELMVLTDPPMLGVAACLPPHVLRPEDRDKAPDFDDIFLDVGLTQEEVERLIPIGTPIVFRAETIPLGERQICGKSMDDRACFAALLRAAELLKDSDLDADLYLLGSVGEEVGGGGAQVAVQALRPDYCVAVDVTFGRTPDSPKAESFVMGGGPCVGIGPNCARWMVRRLLDKAKEAGIEVQKEVMEGSSGTNGWGMQVCNEGVATAVLSIPEKYMHTPAEVVELSDIEETAKLLAAFALDIGKEGGPQW